jgi:hypothetical protein
MALPAWIPEQVAGLAPDASSRKAAEGLAVPHKWRSLGQEAELIWGECQGSGSKPYQTAVALQEPAFRCSCPSRKFPCKHALALFLLFSRQPDLLSTTVPPDWAATWRDSRAERTAQTMAKANQSTNDPAAQAKRAEKREQNVLNGLSELEQWLYDLLRRGLATAQNQPYHYWQSIAARMVDAQAPGLARLLRQMSGIPTSGEGWAERLLQRLALLHLLIQGYRRLDRLSPEIQADVRTAVGWSIKQDEILAGAGVSERWLVLGRRVEEDDGLRTQRTWLWQAERNRPALILDFAYRGQALDATLAPGLEMDAELLFYPGSVPLRALCKTRSTVPRPFPTLSGLSMTAALVQFNGMIARNPWLERTAFPLSSVIPVIENNGSYLSDASHNRLPLAPAFARSWELLALSGGYPITLVAEWDGTYWLPLCVWQNSRTVILA